MGRSESCWSPAGRARRLEPGWGHQTLRGQALPGYRQGTGHVPSAVGEACAAAPAQRPSVIGASGRRLRPFRAPGLLRRLCAAAPHDVGPAARQAFCHEPGDDVLLEMPLIAPLERIVTRPARPPPWSGIGPAVIRRQAHAGVGDVRVGRLRAGSAEGPEGQAVRVAGAAGLTGVRASQQEHAKFDSAHPARARDSSCDQGSPWYYWAGRPASDRLGSAGKQSSALAQHADDNPEILSRPAARACLLSAWSGKLGHAGRTTKAPVDPAAHEFVCHAKALCEVQIDCPTWRRLCCCRLQSSPLEAAQTCLLNQQLLSCSCSCHSCYYL